MQTMERISEILNISARTLEEESIKKFLKIKLRSIEAEVFKIAKKYGIKSVEELDEKLKNGLLEEEDVFEDFKELDYFENEKEKVQKALEEL